MNPDETQQPGFEAMDEAMDLTESDSSHHGLSPVTVLLRFTQPCIAILIAFSAANASPRTDYTL